MLWLLLARPDRSVTHVLSEKQLSVSCFLAFFDGIFVLNTIPKVDIKVPNRVCITTAGVLSGDYVLI